MASGGRGFFSLEEINSGSGQSTNSVQKESHHSLYLLMPTDHMRSKVFQRYCFDISAYVLLLNDVETFTQTVMTEDMFADVILFRLYPS